jgi:hypothetical protein
LALRSSLDCDELALHSTNVGLQLDNRERVSAEFELDRIAGLVGDLSRHRMFTEPVPVLLPVLPGRFRLPPVLKQLSEFDCLSFRVLLNRGAPRPIRCRVSSRCLTAIIKNCMSLRKMAAGRSTSGVIRMVPLSSQLSLDAPPGRQVMNRLRRKHRRISWKDLRRRYCGGQWWPSDGEVILFNPTDAGTTRYRYRGTQIPSPWPIAA